MRTLLLAAAAGLALTASQALAADLYTPGPPVAPPPPAAVVAPLPVPIWTGFYLGINAGLAADRFELPWTVGPASGTSPLNMDRGIGGFQAGYNWQIGPHWVVGLEAESDVSDIVKVRDYTLIAPAGGPTLNVGTNLDWYGTVRPRFGFAVTPSAIFYLTGGFAYGETSNNVVTTGGSISSTSEKYGWASGFGLEYALTDRLTFKSEYIYIDLGNDSFPGGPGTTVNASMIAHTVKAGLNLKLGSWDLR